MGPRDRTEGAPHTSHHHPRSHHATGLHERILAVVSTLGLGTIVLIGMKLRYTPLHDTKHALNRERLERITASVPGALPHGTTED